MVQINFAQKQVNAKIVYYGPGMSGKTTNLEIVHQRAPAPNRGDLTSISTDGDRTLFFDFMPLDLGTVAGMRTCFQLYTVPGQVYYNSTRKLVLQGVDGVVFVADSSASMVEENLESMRNLEQNLAEYGKSLATMPLIIQFNKRDLPDALPVEELQRLLNPYGAPCYEAIANTGQGVFPTLKALAARVLESIHTGSRSPAPAAGIQAGLSQTGFHPAAAMPGTPGAAQRTLQQTGYHAASSVPQVGAPQVAPHAPMQPRPIGMQPAMALQPGQPMQPQPGPMSPQSGHAPQAGMQPGMQTIQMGQPQMSVPMQPQMQVPMQPQMQMPMQPQMHSQMHVPGAIPTQPMQPMQGQALHQTGYGYAPQGQAGMQPSLQAQSAPAAMLAPQPTTPPGSLQMLRVDKGQTAPAPAGAHKPRPGPATAPKPAASKPTAAKATAPQASTGSAPAETGTRIQPRNQPMATPGSGKKRLVYAGVFVVVALGVGAFVAKMVLSVL